MAGEEEERTKQGVTRRRFLGTTTAGAAATLLNTRTARAGATLPTPTDVGSVKATGAGKEVFHGSPAVTKLASAQRTSLQGAISDTSSFGRMFPTLPAFSPSDQALVKLAASIPGRPNVNPNNGTIPAGFTYVGQIIDHDITFDQVSDLFASNDPNGLINTRTARFDLDSAYGAGPEGSPQYYDLADPKKFLLVKNSGIEDIPRESSGTAIIADPRNDQHKIILHLHIAFMKFHNAVVDLLRSQGTSEDEVFALAQQTVRWHYQWIVVHEFLPKVVGQDLVNGILISDESGSHVVTQYYQPSAEDTFMPVEFSAAAFRFGHTMVRDAYVINNGASVPLLGRLLGGTKVTATSQVLLGHFFDIPSSGRVAQPSKQVDARIVLPLGNLPAKVAGGGLVSNLAERNLRRGKSLGLPSGQQVAAFIGATVLGNAELGLTDPELLDEAPLWFYILKEGQIQDQGRRLGQVGGRIVAEVLLGILGADPNSYMNAAPTFQPAPPIAPVAGQFGMSDLILFSGAPV